MNEIPVSVLTITYNHRDFIEECIESVISQKTDFPFNYYIADDGSDDGTQDVILRYAENHSNIYPLLQPERSYFVGNIRTGLSALKSEYVAMCEGDDYWTDEFKLQKQYDFLKKNPDYSLCFHPVKVDCSAIDRPDYVFPIKSNHRFFSPDRHTYYISHLVKGNFIQSVSVMFRWRFRHGLPDWFDLTALPGDWYWNLLHAESGKIGYIDEFMGVYRKHKKGLWSSGVEDMGEHHMKYAEPQLRTIQHFIDHFDSMHKKSFLKFYRYFLYLSLQKYSKIAKSEEELKHIFYENIANKYSSWKEAFSLLRETEKDFYSFLLEEI